MEFIYSLQILCIFLTRSLSRHVHHKHAEVTNMAQSPQPQYYEYSASKEADSTQEKLNHLRYKSEESVEPDNKLAGRTYSRGNRKAKCRCSCDTCMYSTKPCCKALCRACMQPSNVVYIPYPIPLLPLNFSMQPGQSTNQQPTGTVEPTTQSPAAQRTQSTSPLTEINMKDRADTTSIPKCYIPDTSNIIRDSNVDKIDYTIRETVNMDHRPIMRERLDVPKYGIVPIPNNIALKLMNQLRNAKDIQPRNNILRYRERRTRQPYRLRKVIW